MKIPNELHKCVSLEKSDVEIIAKQFALYPTTQERMDAIREYLKSHGVDEYRSHEGNFQRLTAAIRRRGLRRYKISGEYLADTATGHGLRK